jgi:hypothetical protein
MSKISRGCKVREQKASKNSNYSGRVQAGLTDCKDIAVSIGVMEYWSFGVMEYWSDGVME